MRRAPAYLVHPARLAAIGALAALALTVLMLAGRPDAPPEAEASGPQLTIDRAWIGTPTTIELTILGGAAVFTLTPSSGPLVVIGEGTVLVEESVPVGYILTDISCTGGTLAFVPSGGATFVTGDNGVSVTLGPTQHETCTFTNAQTGTLTVVKDFVGAETPVDLLVDGAVLADAVGDGGSTGPTTLPIGTHTVSEALDATSTGSLGDYATTISCDNGDGDSVTKRTSLDVTIAAGVDVTCTITNVRQAQLTIVKDTVPDLPDDFTFSTTNIAGGSTFFLDDPSDGADGVPSSRTLGPLANAGSYKVEETAINLSPGGNTLADFATSISCLDDDTGAVSAAVSIAGRQVTFTPMQGEFVTCTFTNGTAEVTIEKVAVGGDGKFLFDGDPPFGPFLLNSLSMPFQVFHVAPGSYSVAEVGGPDLWKFVDLSCTGSGTGTQDSLNPRQANITVAVGDALTCTWTNEKEATLEIRKDVVVGPENTVFQYSQIGGLTSIAPFTLQESTSTTLGPVVVAPDDYAFDEVLPGASWTLSGLSCTGTSSAFPGGGGTVIIGIAAGQTVVCTVENTKAPTLLVEKATALPDDFFFAVDEPDLVTNAEGFPILGPTGVLDGVLGNGDSVGVAVANNVPVEIVELALTGAPPIISCTNVGGEDLFAAGRAKLTRNGAGVEVTPQDSEDITCTFDNDIGSLTIVKDTVPAGAATVFGFNATGLASSSFMLADGQQLVFDGIADGTTVSVGELAQFGFELTSIACTGNSASTVAVDEATGALSVTLAGGEQVVCTFVNTDVDADDDGILDRFELLLGTDPNNADTDGDGRNDGDELFIDNTNPADPTNSSPPPDDGLFGSVPPDDGFFGGNPPDDGSFGTNPPDDGLFGGIPPDDGLQGAPLSLFSPPVAPQGATLTQYIGGRSLGQLIADLRARNAATATLTLPNGSTATAVATDLEFVQRAFVASFLGVDADEVDAALTSMGLGGVLDVQIPPGALMFVRGVMNIGSSGQDG